MDYKKLTKVADDRQFVGLDADLVARWNEYCENNSYYDDMIYSMDEFDELMEGRSPHEIARMVFYGHDFNPNYDWFWFNGYGNLESSDYTNQYCPIDLDAIAEEDEDEDEDEEVDETEVEDTEE